VPNSNPACNPQGEHTCRGCFGDTPPSTVNWHNLDTGENAILDYLGDYAWKDSLDLYLFNCHPLAVTIHAEVLYNGVGGLIDDCNYSNPINYQFAMSDGSTVVVSA
tara:strand:- start:2249 stop:2566 length:318 start_codon:yes stop_codon:yes gene_type:complete